MADLAIVDATTAIDRPASAAEIRATVTLIQEVMKAVMKDGVHYGTIPGTPKPTLYKAGAEKILSTFRIGVDPEVEDLSTEDEARVRVRARGVHQRTGQYLGAGVGECSSNEDKYRWRATVSDAEWDATPEDRRRIKYVRIRKSGDTGETRQVRTHPADIANTVLKMAKKRAQIDLCLTVTAASDVFAQDIEDLPAEIRETVVTTADQKPPPMHPPQRRADAPPAQAPPDGVPRYTITKVVELKQGTNATGEWTLYGIETQELGARAYITTFDGALAQAARRAAGARVAVPLVFQTRQDGQYVKRELVEIHVGREPGEDDA